MTEKDIKDILKDNEVVMDPIAEAFHMLDHDGCGYLTSERICTITQNLGHGGTCIYSKDELILIGTIIYDSTHHDISISFKNYAMNDHQNLPMMNWIT